MAKTIAIIGAGPGIGLAIAQRFGREGFQVALLGRSVEKLSKFVERLTSEGITAQAFKADVMDRPGLTQALENVIQVWGSIEVLEYGPAPQMNALKTLSTLDEEAAQQQFDFTVLGAIAAVRAVLPGMQARKEGTILFTTAISAQYPLNITASFGISAGAQLNYARLRHNNLKADHIYAGIVSITALIAADEEREKELKTYLSADIPVLSPEVVAEQHWAMYQERKQCEVIVGDIEKLRLIPGFEA